MLQQSLFALRPAWTLAALAALGRHQFLSAPQLSGALRRTVPEIEAALDPLVEARLLGRLETPAINTQARIRAYTLTPRGARFLAASTGRPAIATANVTRSVYLLAHELARADFGLRLEALAEAGRLRLRAWECSPSRIGEVAHLVERGSPVRVPLVADALAVFEDARPGVQGLLVEVDMGTVSAKRMALKYRGYLAWFRDGGHVRRFGLRGLRVLTLVPDARRRASLEALARQATDGRGSALFWFAEHEPLNTATMSSAPTCTVTSARYPQGAPLLELRPPPSTRRSRGRGESS